MRYCAVLAILCLCGCAATSNQAPIHFKNPVITGPAVDGVELAVLCELADRIGTEYLAPGIDAEAAQELQDQRRYLNLLTIEGVSCGRPENVIDLPFISDEERRLVSTWGSFEREGEADGWGSCLADTSRPPNDRVVFCEVSTPMPGMADAPALPEFAPLPDADTRAPEGAVPETPEPEAPVQTNPFAGLPPLPGDEIAPLPAPKPETDPIEGTDTGFRPVPQSSDLPLDLSPPK